MPSSPPRLSIGANDGAGGPSDSVVGVPRRLAEALEKPRDTFAKISYLVPNPPEMDVEVPEPGVSKEEYRRRRDMIMEERTLLMQDARRGPGASGGGEGLESWRLDLHGFCCVPVPVPGFVDFQDQKLTKEIYWPKLLELAKAASGAAQGYMLSGGTLRGEPKQGPEEFGLYGGAYAQYAHSDYGKDCEETMRYLLTERFKIPESEVAEEVCDLCVVNVWHPRDWPAYKWPLCLLDASSVDWSERDGPVSKWVSFDTNNLIHGVNDPELRKVLPQAYKTLGRNTGGDRFSGSSADSLIVGALYQTSHRWIFCPDQRPEEAWIFKQWDSRHGVARQAFHNSFADPFHEDDPDCPGRRSIEFRILLTFPKGSPRKREEKQESKL